MTGFQKSNLRDYINTLENKILPNGTRVRQIIYELSKGPKCFCALGVACEIYGLDNDIGWREDEIEERTFLGESTYLPDKVKKHFGFRNNSPYLLVPKKLRKKIPSEERAADTFDISYLNDELGFTFPQIADCLRYTFFMTKKERQEYDSK